MGSFAGLLNNAVLMLVLCVIYDNFGVYGLADRRLRDGISGILVGVIAVAVMLTPWSLQPGVFFDTRWVLLSLCGLFFGLAPTLIAVVIAGTFRLYQGGAGGVVGTVVIVVTAAVGLAWRLWRERRRSDLNWKELYVFGVVVQLAMLACIVLMPAHMRWNIIKAVGPPILLIYPPLTMFIGIVLRRQEERREVDRELDETRQALDKERGMLRGVIDGFPEMMMVIGDDHRIRLANKAAAEAAGVPLPKLVGRTCHSVSHASDEPCHGPEHMCPLKQVMETKHEVTVEHVHLDAQGRERNIELVAAPILDEAGEVVQIIESCRDITNRREAEKANLNLERQVQHAQKLESLGILAGGIAHDFNNILMGVLGNTDLAMRKVSLESPVWDHLRSIESAAMRAADLAKQMLAYSGKGRFVVETINVNRLVEEMTHLLRTTVSKKAALKFHLAESIPPIQADVTQIRQVFMNLITNASEALGDESGVITVSTGVVEMNRDYLGAGFPDALEDGRYTFIEVSDTGCGMDRETQQKMFDPFFTTKFTGRGLGMAATLGIVRGHSGAVKVYSEPGSGTAIKVVFPCAEGAEAALIAPTDESPPLAQWRGEGTILVVDDEETVREIAELTLTECGFRVLLAGDGEEGLRRFREEPDAIRLVLLDMTMPKMGGEETYRALRRIRPDVLVLLSSGYNEQEAVNRFAGKGLAGFIQKPYRPRDLMEKLRGVLTKRTTT